MRGVNWFSDRRIWHLKAHELWIFAVHRADSWISKTLWIVDQFRNFVFRIPEVGILDRERNLDQRSLFSLGRIVNKFIQIISFSNKAHLNLDVKPLLELCCVTVIKHVAFTLFVRNYW